MANVVRRCTKCGHEDAAHRWNSIDDALNAGALRSSWACPECAWPEPELVESGNSAQMPDHHAQAAPDKAPD